MESQNSEFKLVSNVKSHKKGFYRYNGKQRENQWYCEQLTDTGHARGWCFQSLLHLSIYWQGQASWASMPSGRWDVLPTAAEHQSKDHLHKLVTYKRVDETRWDPSEEKETRSMPLLGCSLSPLRKHRNLVKSLSQGKKGKCYTCLQNAEERGFRKLRANQLHISPWKCYRTNSPRNHFEL